MKVSTRLALGFGSLILLIVIISVTSFSSIRKLNSEVSSMATDRYPKTIWANQIIDHVHQIARAMRNTLILDDKAAVQREISVVEEQQKIILDCFEKLKGSIQTDDDKAAVQKALDFRTLYLEGQEHFLRMIELGLKQQAIDYLLTTVGPQQQGYIDAIEELTQYQSELMVKAGEKSEALASRAGRIVGGLGAAALLVAAGMAFTIIRSLRRQLGGEPQYAAAAVRRIANGDLTVDIEVTSADSGSLLGAMAQMQTSLRRLVGEVRVGVESVSAASAQIASGNLDLSDRTERQAGSLQKTASSMEQLTASVKQSAESAKQADQLVSAAGAAAAKGGEVVGQVVSMMEEIVAASRRIGEIVNVIDEIAFRTNILALNAAVEAARAGEHGRGFAVVAGEVRNLAQRSAQAAREIKVMISDTVGKVNAGSALVHDAGISMTEIVSQVKRVTDLIQEIASAAVEESSGIGDVSKTVTHMDEVTQQNAALVEELAAAAASLKDQAERLAGLVSVFKIATQTRQIGSTDPKISTTSFRSLTQKALDGKPQSKAAALPATATANGDWEEF